MDWQLAITRNREALLSIVAALFALAGLVEGKVPGILPRHIHSAIFRILRPAESAVRRLIMIAARGLVLAPRSARPAPFGIIPNPNTARVPSFSLLDPLKRFTLSSNTADDTSLWDDENENDDLTENTTFTRAIPRISLPGLFDPIFTPPEAALPDGLVNANHLANRLIALQKALDTLPNQARRLARWQAKRALLRQQFPLRPLRLAPFRPGFPSGHRRHHVDEVHGILRECHLLMLDACSQSDTS
jgi:hypothetical protein